MSKTEREVLPKKIMKKHTREGRKKSLLIIFTIIFILWAIFLSVSQNQTINDPVFLLLVIIWFITFLLNFLMIDHLWAYIAQLTHDIEELKNE